MPLDLPEPQNEDELPGAEEDGLDGLVPQRENMHIPDLSVEPSVFFAELQAAKDPGTSILLDARNGDFERAIKWGTQFLELEAAAGNHLNFELMKVMMVSPSTDMSLLPSEWRLSSLFDIVEAEEAGDIRSQYIATVAKDLREVLSKDPYEGLSREEDLNALPLEMFIHEDERDEYEKRLVDLDGWNKGEIASI